MDDEKPCVCSDPPKRGDMLLVAAKCVPPIVPNPVLCVEEKPERADTLELLVLPKCEELMLLIA